MDSKQEQSSWELRISLYLLKKMLVGMIRTCVRGNFYTGEAGFLQLQISSEILDFETGEGHGMIQMSEKYSDSIQPQQELA